MRKLIRLTTVSRSLTGLLKGQLKFLSSYFDVLAVADGPNALQIVSERENVRTKEIKMRRDISLFHDIVSLFDLIVIFLLAPRYYTFQYT